jgi:two-component system sensor histidine kinase KdpD
MPTLWHVVLPQRQESRGSHRRGALVGLDWGWWKALAAAVLAFIACDFVFVDPRFTFTIRDPEEWLALLIFLAVAAVTSNLAARERARREQASRQARTATLLDDLGRAVTSAGRRAGLRAVAQRLYEEFRLDSAVIARSDDAKRLQVPVANFPLKSDHRQIGMLRLVGRPSGFADDEPRLLAAIADRLAIDLGQETLREEANRAEVLRRTDELRTACSRMSPTISGRRVDSVIAADLPPIPGTS